MLSPSKIPNLWQRLYIHTYGGGVALAVPAQLVLLYKELKIFLAPELIHSSKCSWVGIFK